MFVKSKWTITNLSTLSTNLPFINITACYYNNSFMCHSVESKSCVSMLTLWSRLSHAGSFCWVSPLSDPLLLPLWSRSSRLIHPVRLLVACWNMPWLVVLPEWSRETETSIQTHTYIEGEKRLVVNSLPVWSDPTQRESPAAPGVDRLLLMSTPECTHWRRGAWMEELHCCPAARWVSNCVWIRASDI